MADHDSPQVEYHGISWDDFDALARGGGDDRVVRQLQRAERSRRLLLLRSLVERVSSSPHLVAPLPSPFVAWDLLARVEQDDPAVLDLVLAHPYTGSWTGYTTRLLNGRISGAWPFWVHFGYIYALAASAAIRANVRFDILVPVWLGDLILPTLGRVPAPGDTSVAEIVRTGRKVEVHAGSTVISLPSDLSEETPHWQPVRQLVAQADGRFLSVRLDDVDPYRETYGPQSPQRVSHAESAAWQLLTSDAWALLVDVVPQFADGLRAGFESLAPRPLTLIRASSASTSDAFGSAVLDRPADPESLAAMLVHEFQHSKLIGLTHLTRLWHDDPRERLYAPWRDDPRPIGGMVQGLYAFTGMTAFWRELAGNDSERGQFEFACHRAMAWRAAKLIRSDAALTETGLRFLKTVTETLEPWQADPVPSEVDSVARRTLADHYLGWRIRHIRPDSTVVRELAEAWTSRRHPASRRFAGDPLPTPIADGDWSHSRTDLTRLAISRGRKALKTHWKTVPRATSADFLLVLGQYEDAIREYRARLSEDPDNPASLAGLAVALSAVSTSPASRTLMDHPELVRAVHRAVRAHTAKPPAVEQVADWIGRNVL
ncbi:aKG-HExxH-type peptide beta-hydroxylase [Kibdelosporangium aridum]|uniref:HEXXH motif-containing protein n=1 Tax=Kibdelosporangium aridum TaxID=2030 RepID=A0A1W2FZ82_KIBAR|nr:HEXXH motif-containing putative peptide modification protein [Kibdelosporangium aridum]SMD27173.1 HEXXH motif-containing protein [Kibdelosporangium aridum]